MSLTVFYIMAEFDEALGLMGDADEGIDGEVKDDDELTEEEKEELEKEAKEASENIDKLEKVVSKLKELDIPQMLRKFTVFIVEQAAIGAIFYGVSILLKKLTGGGGGNTEANRKKLAKTKALSTLLKDLTDASNAIVKWLKEKENVRVKVDGGIEVPLVDLFIEYTDKISKVSFKI